MWHAMLIPLTILYATPLSYYVIRIHVSGKLTTHPASVEAFAKCELITLSRHMGNTLADPTRLDNLGKLQWSLKSHCS